MKKESIIIGTKINEWTILRDDGYKNGSRIVYCRCSCGNEKQIYYSHLKRGMSKSCGRCEYAEVNPGDRFGQWEVLSVDTSAPKGTRRYALCRCACGNEKRVACSKLVSGKSKSCGCWRNHAKDYPRLYNIYKHMIGRCYNLSDAKYKDYGARGITICNEWKESHGFDNFLKWALRSGYQEDCNYGECTIDRIDVNKGYEPTNCRWTNLKVQANNKRNNIVLKYNGETHTIAEWAEILKVSSKKLYSRFHRGYPIEDILFCGDFDSHRRRIL